MQGGKLAFWVDSAQAKVAAVAAMAVDIVLDGKITANTKGLRFQHDGHPAPGTLLPLHLLHPCSSTFPASLPGASAPLSLTLQGLLCSRLHHMRMPPCFPLPAHLPSAPGRVLPTHVSVVDLPKSGRHGWMAVESATTPWKLDACCN